MKYVLSLVGLVAGIVTDLLEENTDEVEHHLPTHYVFGEATPLGLLDCFASLLYFGGKKLGSTWLSLSRVSTDRIFSAWRSSA